MSYGSAEFLQALLDVREGKLNADQHEEMELFLLRRVQDKGTQGVEAMLNGLDTNELGRIEISYTGDELSALVSGEGVDSVLIKAAADEFSAYAVVNLHATTLSTPVINPQHAWFYSTWEAVQGDEFVDLAGRTHAERAVFWIALLESQVMNGGLGQYLSNSNGAYLADTLACLEAIGASKTRELLRAADKLADGADSYDAAWDDLAGDYGKLDDAFMKSGEDLAALTATRYQD